MVSGLFVSEEGSTRNLSHKPWKLRGIRVEVKASCCNASRSGRTVRDTWGNGTTTCRTATLLKSFSREFSYYLLFLNPKP